MKLRNSTYIAIIEMMMLLHTPPPVYGSDIRFAVGKSALGIPFESDNDVIYVLASVNDSPPFTFILDTGASYSILDLRHAKSFGLGLQPLGKVEGGSGAEPPDAYLSTDSVSISLPGVMLASQSVRVMLLDKVQGCIETAADGRTAQRSPSDQKANGGTRLDGILGADFFSNLVVEIDYESKLINLHDPAGYHYKGRGKSLPLEREGYIFVRGQVTAYGHPPVTARLFVDTGASVVLSLTEQFSRTHGILPPANQLTASKNCGIGGFTKETSWFGSLQRLQIGGFRVSRPVTMFYEDADIHSYDGSLGGAAFRHCKVIFDYSRSRMIVEPLRGGARNE